MSLIDLITSDLAVFDEISETHIIDGKSVMCVLDSDQDLTGSGQLADFSAEIRRVLHIRDGLLRVAPAVGRKMVIDGKGYTCLDVSRETGMLRVTLRQDVSLM